MYKFLKFDCVGTRKWILTATLCVIWYLVSLLKALLAKYISTVFHRPLTLSFTQLLSISIYSVPLLFFCKLKFNCVTKYYFFRFFIPLAALKAFTTASGHLAIWNVSLSYSQIMRATMPIFTALFSWILLSSRLSIKGYLTLIPIVAGVVLTTVTETEFSLFGMICGLLAASGSSLQSIFNKIWMKNAEIHSFQLAALLGWGSTSIFFFVWFAHDGLELFQTQNNTDFSALDSWKVPGLLVLDGFIKFVQNTTSFAILFLITPTSYAVANVTKRPAIIAISIYVFNNVVTLLNILGIVILVIGSSLYTYVKLAEKNTKHVQTPTAEITTEVVCSDTTIPPIKSV